MHVQPRRCDCDQVGALFFQQLVGVGVGPGGAAAGRRGGPALGIGVGERHNVYVGKAGEGDVETVAVVAAAGMAEDGGAILRCITHRLQPLVGS